MFVDRKLDVYKPVKVQVLRKIRSLLEHGWCKRRPVQYRDGVLHMCLYEAVSRAIEQTVKNKPLRWDIHKQMRWLFDNEIGLTPSVPSIIYWNDQQRSVDPVLAMIDRCLAKLEHT